MNSELESWVDEMIDDLEPIDIDIDNVINYRLAEMILNNIGENDE
jgi:hypothetical protein